MDPITATPGAPAAPSVPVDPAPAAPTQTGEPAAPTPAPEPAPATPEPKHDPQAAQRYAMMQERKARQEAERKNKDLEAKLAEQPPVFDETTDPDGTKQIEYLA